MPANIFAFAFDYAAFRCRLPSLITLMLMVSSPLMLHGYVISFRHYARLPIFAMLTPTPLRFRRRRHVISMLPLPAIVFMALLSCSPLMPRC